MRSVTRRPRLRATELTDAAADEKQVEREREPLEPFIAGVAGSELHQLGRLARQPPHPQLARQLIDDCGDHLRRVHLQTRPGPNETHGRHPRDCGGRSPISSA